MKFRVVPERFVNEAHSPGGDAAQNAVRSGEFAGVGRAGVERTMPRLYFESSNFPGIPGSASGIEEGADGLPESCIRSAGPGEKLDLLTGGKFGSGMKELLD